MMKLTEKFGDILGLVNLALLYRVLVVGFFSAGQWDISNGSMSYIEVLLFSAGFSLIGVVMVVSILSLAGSDKW